MNRALALSGDDATPTALWGLRHLAFARSAGLDDVAGFERSHASVLLTPAIFSDDEAFLRRRRPSPCRDLQRRHRR